MQLSRYDTRGLAVLALVICAALLSLAAGRYFLSGVHDLDAIGKKPSLVSEFGARVPISQSFTVQRDGLHSITVAISSDQAADLAFEMSLIRKGARADWPDEPITKQIVHVSVPEGVTRETIDFPAVTRSKDRTFVATFTLSDVKPQGSLPTAPHVALAGWADDASRSGSLKVGADDRWGDLAFSAQVDPPTRLGRLIDSVNRTLTPAVSVGRASFGVLAAFYGLLLGIVCYLGMRAWRPVDRWSAAAAEVVNVESPTVRPLRIAVTVILAAATPLLFIAILVTRERVTVNLLDELDSARMESPAGMHGGFSRIEEVINGFAPPALFAHPPSRITWTVQIPVQKPVFRANLALRPYVWEHRSDGVTFEVMITDGSHETKVSRFLSPGSNLNDRAWVEMAIDLSKYAGRQVDLSLTTSAGPRGDPAWDWALWGNPRIVSLRWFDVYGRAMRALNRDQSGD